MVEGGRLNCLGTLTRSESLSESLFDSLSDIIIGEECLPSCVCLRLFASPEGKGDREVVWLDSCAMKSDVEVVLGGIWFLDVVRERVVWLGSDTKVWLTVGCKFACLACWLLRCDLPALAEWFAVFVVVEACEEEVTGDSFGLFAGGRGVWFVAETTG